MGDGETGTRVKLLNGNAVVDKGKTPYEDWIANVDGGPLEAESTVYLLPEALDPDHFQRILRKHFATIFRMELAGWQTYVTAWPKKRDWKTFCAWFHVEYASDVEDLTSGLLKGDEF